MAKVHLDQIEKTQQLLNGLKKNLTLLKDKGLDENFIKQLEADNNQAIILEGENEKLKAEVKIKTASTMERIGIALEELSSENVRNLTEENVAQMLNRLISDYPKEKRSQYVTILGRMFDFRSISSNKPEIKRVMMNSGYKFFPIPYNNKLIMAIKNKKNRG